MPKRHTRRHATITCFPFPFLARSEKCFEFRHINNPPFFPLVTRHSTPLPGHLSTTVSSSVVHLCIIINKSSNPTEPQHPIRLPGKSYSFSSNPQPTEPETPRSTARAFARASEGERERGKTNEGENTASTRNYHCPLPIKPTYPYRKDPTNSRRALPLSSAPANQRTSVRQVQLVRIISQTNVCTEQHYHRKHREERRTSSAEALHAFFRLILVLLLLLPPPRFLHTPSLAFSCS